MTYPRTFAAGIAVALICAAGCAPKVAVTTPAPVSAPAVAPPLPLMDRCPDQSDGPSLIAMAIEGTHRALAADGAAKLPPSCVVLAFARIPGAVPDSLDEHALTVA